MTRREMVQRVSAFMVTFMPGQSAPEPTKEITPPTFHPVYIEHMTARPMEFDEDMDRTLFGQRMSVLLTNGQILRCPMVWTARDLEGKSARELSTLFQQLTENWFNSIMDVIDNGARRA